MRARLLDQLVAGVAVGHAQHPPARLGQRLQLQRLGGGEAQRLLAHHMQAGLQRGLADLEVRAVGRGDRDGLQTVGAACLDLEHRAVALIAALGGHAQALAEVAARRRVDVEGAGHQPEMAIAQRR